MSDNRETWTIERMDALRAMWAEGISAGKIGKAIGVGKNAVVSKKNRMGLPDRPSPIVHLASDAPRLRPYQRKHPKVVPLPPPASVVDSHGFPVHHPDRVAAGGRSSKPVPPQIVAPPPPPAPPAIDVNRHCCWPLWGNEKITHRYCDAPVQLGRPYCPDHHAKAHSPMVGKDPDLAPWAAPGRPMIGAHRG